MRPVRLEFEAFGPFPGTEVVDFGPLDDLGLYLVSGPTGAGKTSIFDAMVFALYGRVPGARGRSDTNLRSNFASDSATARVSLEFEARGDLWRAERQPAQRRMKQKGSGHTIVAPKATLERHDGTNWQQAESGKRKVDDRVAQLVGLDQDQFSQVVLLPQGEFQQVLRAEPRERERLMRRLFATEGYDRAIRHLEEQARNARNRAREAASEVGEARSGADRLWNDLLTGVRNTASSTGLEVPSWEDDHLDALDGRKAREKFAEAWLSTLVAARKVADGEAEAADAAHRELEAEACRFVDAEGHRRTLAQLEETQEEADEQAAVLDRGRKATPVVEALAVLDGLVGALEAAESAHASAVEALIEAGLPKADVPPTPARANTATTRWSESGARFAGLVETLADAIQNEEAEATHRAQADTAREAVVAADAEITTRATELAELEEQHEAARTAQDGFPAADDALKNAEAVTSAVGDLKDARRAVRDAEKALRIAEKARSSAETALEEERSLETLDLAGQLARDALVEGEPCPVCGSEDHPAPAVPAKGRRATALKDAEGALRSADAAEGEAKGALTTARGAVTKAEKAFGGLGLGDPPDDLVPLVGEAATNEKEAKAKLTPLRKLAETATPLAKKVDGARGLLQKAKDGRTSQEAEATRLDGLAAEASSKAKEFRRRVTKAVGDDDPADRQAEAEAIVAALGGLVEALGKLEMSTKARDTQQRSVDRLVVSAGFEDHDAARAAARPEGELTALDEQLEERRSTQQEARAALQELEKQGVPDEVPDVATAAAASQEAAARATTLGDAVTRIDERRRTFKAAVDNARDRVEAAAEVSAAADLADKVDKVCRGIRGTRSLESWVLARHLRAVAGEASQRFQGVSAGRFVFTVVESTDDDDRQGPARLEITDHYNGETRAVSSLSGGETFQASLSLALGLADTVQQRQGGVHIDSLFVDEGFGSLDPESLDQAMDVLEELQEGGRTVGVISHVSEMKQRIVTGLDVVKRDKGSHIVPGRE